MDLKIKNIRTNSATQSKITNPIHGKGSAMLIYYATYPLTVDRLDWEQSISNNSIVIKYSMVT
ncbi:MAG TPA: hypothetical protein VFD00_01060 [Thermoclostridium sp.]|nr:hypothetical protein [Thermoclostridium sp.]